MHCTHSGMSSNEFYYMQRWYIEYATMIYLHDQIVIETARDSIYVGSIGKAVYDLNANIEKGFFLCIEQRYIRSDHL